MMKSNYLTGHWEIYDSTRPRVSAASGSVGTLCDFTESGIVKIRPPEMRSYHLKYEVNEATTLVLHYSDKSTQSLEIKLIDGEPTKISITDMLGKTDFLRRIGQ